jgi:hypothetical protein
MAGLSAERVRPLLRDTSRSKYGSSFDDAFSLRNACLVVLQGGGPGAGPAGGRTALHHQFIAMTTQRDLMLLGYAPAYRTSETLSVVRRVRGSERSTLDRCRRRALGIGVPYALGMTAPDGRPFGMVAGAEASASQAQLLLLASLSHGVASWEAHRWLPRVDSALFVPWSPAHA